MLGINKDKNIKSVRLGISSDHGGYGLKEYIYNNLIANGYNVKNFGVYNEESVDYPGYALKIILEILNKDIDFGILFCGTGIGVSISANKFPGIRAALCHNVETARLSRMHNNANIIALGGRILDKNIAAEMIDVWLNTDFEGGRHLRRVNLIDKQALPYWEKYIKEEGR